MALSWLDRLLKRKSGPVSRRPVSPRGRKKPGHARFVLAVESLADRVLPAVTATFLPNASTLSIFGDAQDNTIVVSRDAAGNLLVNGGAVAIQGGADFVRCLDLDPVAGLRSQSSGGSGLPSADFSFADRNGVVVGPDDGGGCAERGCA